MASSKAPVELALPQGRSMVPMRDIQTQIIAQLGVQAQIDPAQEIQRRVNFLVDYLQATGTRGFVLGISGGIDSTLAGRLCQLAVEQLAVQGQQAEFVAMRLPYQVQADESDAQAALDFIQQIGTIVSYNAVWKTKAKDHLQHCPRRGRLRQRLRPGQRRSQLLRLQPGQHQGPGPHDRPVRGRR